ncbi:hypothetical protein M885DRAFT_540554 [Pelagophyceae sp. CCMP2097]|nr:hypothetical protein M885DRAFT_540554 [Pelagophyceae sp. CCMP2097]|mmetsp:Transcript_28807/g.97103  ORF Transcript_28807/g.97103 Transcript_28807/m.97103 type:complete len:509 (+) Transcript_28807:110-1636(+)
MAMYRVTDADLECACVVAEVNPKKPGTKSYERYELYKTATRLGDVIILGGLRADISHDLEKGFITAEGVRQARPADDADYAAAAPPPPQSATKRRPNGMPAKAKVAVEDDDGDYVDSEDEADEADDGDFDEEYVDGGGNKSKPKPPKSKKKARAQQTSWVVVATTYPAARATEASRIAAQRRETHVCASAAAAQLKAAELRAASPRFLGPCTHSPPWDSKDDEALAGVVEHVRIEVLSEDQLRKKEAAESRELEMAAVYSSALAPARAHVLLVAPPPPQYDGAAPIYAAPVEPPTDEVHAVPPCPADLDCLVGDDGTVQRTFSNAEMTSFVTVESVRLLPAAGATQGDGFLQAALQVLGLVAGKARRLREIHLFDVKCTDEFVAGLARVAPDVCVLSCLHCTIHPDHFLQLAAFNGLETLDLRGSLDPSHGAITFAAAVADVAEAKKAHVKRPAPYSKAFAVILGAAPKLGRIDVTGAVDAEGTLSFCLDAAALNAARKSGIAVHIGS